MTWWIVGGVVLAGVLYAALSYWRSRYYHVVRRGADGRLHRVRTRVLKDRYRRSSL